MNNVIPRILLLGILFCTFRNAHCESVSDSSRVKYNVKLSYNSSLIYPGASAGIEFRVQESSFRILKNQQIAKSFVKERLVSGNINWYHHPNFHDNLYFTVEWVMRRIKSTGLISEFSAGPGFSRTFLGGTTYKVDDNGNVSVVRLAGYNYLLITVGGGFGYDFSVKQHLPLAAIGKLNIISMYPYNSTLYIRPVLEFGVRYNPQRSKGKKWTGKEVK